MKSASTPTPDLERIDTSFGLSQAIGGRDAAALSRFRALCAERRLAVRGETGNERNLLGRHVVFGGFLLDEFGQVSVIGEENRADLCGVFYEWRKRPLVLAEADFYAALRQEGYSTQVKWCMGGSSFAPEGAVCACCGSGWTLETAALLRSAYTDIPLPLSDYAGRLFHEVAKELTGWEAGAEKRRFQFVRTTERPISKGGQVWVEAGEEYRIESGDVASANVSAFYHHACWDKKLAIETEASFRAAFREAEIPILGVAEAKNRYGSRSYNGPWFHFATAIGLIRVGWRKRVVEIELHAEPGAPLAALDLQRVFASENVTKEKALVHAHDLNRLAKYLRLIREAASR